MLRVVVVSTILLSAFLIQFTFSTALPLNDIYYLAAFAYSISIAAILSLDRIPPEANAAIQLLGDLFVITGLVYISGGADSSFSFLYLGTVAAGAILLGRQGGLVAAGLAAVFYAVLVDLMYFEALKPVPTAERTPHLWTPAGLAGQVALHAGALSSPPLVSSSTLEQARETRTDLERQVGDRAPAGAALVRPRLDGVRRPDDGPEGSSRSRTARRRSSACPPSTSSGSPCSPSASSGRRGAGSRRPVPRSCASRRRAASGPGRVLRRLSSALRDGTGYTVGRVLIFQNVTHVKRLEGEVRRKDKLAASASFAAGIAHEIRNPHASISGSVQALQGSVPSDSPEHRLMKIVVAESHRLSSILEDFLRYVRPKERALESVDAPAALRDVVTLLEHSDEVSPRHAIDVRTAPDSFVLPADPDSPANLLERRAQRARRDAEGRTLTVTATLEARPGKSPSRTRATG